MSRAAIAIAVLTLYLVSNLDLYIATLAAKRWGPALPCPICIEQQLLELSALTLISVQVGSLPTAYGIDITTATNALAAVRAALQGASVDYGIANKAGSTLSDVDSNALVFSRSVQVSFPLCASSPPSNMCRASPSSGHPLLHVTIFCCRLHVLFDKCKCLLFVLC